MASSVTNQPATTGVSSLLVSFLMSFVTVAVLVIA